MDETQKSPAGKTPRPSPYKYPCPHCGAVLEDCIVLDPAEQDRRQLEHEDMVDTIRQSRALWGDKPRGY